MSLARSTTAQTNPPAPVGDVLARKCACGTHTIAGGTCDACRGQQLPTLQTKLRVGPPGDAFEQEADRLASAVATGRVVSGQALHGGVSRRAAPLVRRQEAPEKKSAETQLKEGAKKVGEAFLETPLGKDIKSRAAALGDEFLSTLPGKIITGSAAAGAIAAIVATDTELPVGIPDIPLDVVRPGLKVKITYEGPAQKPTRAAITFSGTFGAPKPAPGAKAPVSEKEKFRAETARMAAEQQQFREGLKTPEQRGAEKKEFWDAYWRMRSEDPLNPLRLGGKPPAAAAIPAPAPAPAPELEPEKKKEDDTLQRRLGAGTGRRQAGAGDEAPAIVSALLSSSAGRPLDGDARAYMEAHLGHDFGDVRLHTGPQAAASARAVNALAYTVGRHLVLAEPYAPHTHSGRLLLAHELVHTIQQGAARPLPGSAGHSARRASRPDGARPASAPLPAAGAAVSVQRRAAPPAGPALPALHLPIQARLHVDAPDDPYEREAERLARQVMQSHAPTPPPADGGDDDEGQAAPAPAGVTPHPGGTVQPRLSSLARLRAGSTTALAYPVGPHLEATIRRLLGTGTPLPAAERAFFEQRLGVDLGRVRVHADSQAADVAAALSARAFTLGSDLFFDAGQYAPGTWHGRHLLAHELAHVIQQGAAPTLRPPLPAVLPPSHAPAAQVQRSIVSLLDSIPGIDVNALFRNIPGYTLFTVVIGFNPVTGRTVDRNAINLLEGLMGLVPFGTQIFDALQARGIIQDAFRWVEGQLSRLDLSLGRIERTAEAAWDDMGITLGFSGNLAVLRRHFGALLTDVTTFARSLVDHVVQLIKDAALGVAEGLLAENRAWALIKKVLHHDPLRDQPVEATTVEILEDFLLLIGKEQELQQMRERGAVEQAAAWIDTQLATFMSLLAELGGLFSDAWAAIQPENLPNLMANLEQLARRAVGFLQRVWDFAATVALEVLRLIKDALLGWLSEFAHEVPGFHLITVILGRNPFTGQAVPRTVQNIIRGFITLLPGGSQQYDQLEQTGAVGQAAAAIETAMETLGISWEFVVGLFTGIWDSLTIEDLINPIAAFTRIRDQFGEPISRLFAFIQVVVREIFSVVLALMHFPTDILQRIITNAMQAFDDIKRDPVGFLVNMLQAVKLGFSHFFDHILQHLLAGVTDWLFGQLRQAGIEPPADLSLGSILGLVGQILGITVDRIWQKLAERLGQQTVDRIRGAIDRLAGIWNFVRDVQERGFAAIWEYIEGQISSLWDMVLDKVRDWIVTRIVERVVTRLLSMLDPTGIMAVINAFVAFFNAVQSAIEYLREMLEIVDRYVSTLASVARGDVEPGAQMLEQGLASSIPVAIGFLANQVGLGRLADKIAEMVSDVRALVDRALDWLVDQAVRLGSSVLETIQAGVSAVRAFFGQRTTFRDGRGASHALYYEERGGRVVLLVASSPQSIREFLDFYVDEYDITPDSPKGQLAAEIRADVATEIDPVVTELNQARQSGDTATQEAKERELLGKNTALSQKMSRLLAGDRDVGRIIDSYLLEGMTGTFASLPKAYSDDLTPDHQPQAAILQWAARQDYFDPTSNMARRAASRANQGYAINLFVTRHKEGRTYGNKGKGTRAEFVTNATSAIASLSTTQDKRAAVVDLMKQDLRQDVQAMETIAGRPNSHAVWADIRALDISQQEKDTLINTIRQNILNGERQLASQDMESLKS